LFGIRQELQRFGQQGLQRLYEWVPKIPAVDPSTTDEATDQDVIHLKSSQLPLDSRQRYAKGIGHPSSVTVLIGSEVQQYPFVCFVSKDLLHHADYYNTKAVHMNTISVQFSYASATIRLSVQAAIRNSMLFPD
jgi:hypothetical protein